MYARENRTQISSCGKVLPVELLLYVLLCRYIPTARVQYEYPGQYQASDSRSCSSDANLLLHDDPDHYDDPYADPYEDNPESQHSRCPAEEAELQNQEAAAAAAETGGVEAEESRQGASIEAQDQSAHTEEERQDDSLLEGSVGTDVKR